MSAGLSYVLSLWKTLKCQLLHLTPTVQLPDQDYERSPDLPQMRICFALGAAGAVSNDLSQSGTHAVFHQIILFPLHFPALFLFMTVTNHSSTPRSLFPLQ